MRNRSAFTLLEITIVLIIIGILSAIAVPRFGDAVERARAQEGIVALHSLYEAQVTYEIENGAYTDDVADLDITIPDFKYFTDIANGSDPVVFPGGGVVVLTRNAGGYHYTLSIDASEESPSILCTNGAGNFCEKLADGHSIVLPAGP